MADVEDDALYAAFDRDLRVTDDVDDALFIDKAGRLRTHPTKKPPPGGTPAHKAALLEVPEFRTVDSPVSAALRSGAIRVRTVRTRGSLTLSMDAYGATDAQLRRIAELVRTVRPRDFDLRVTDEVQDAISEAGAPE